MKIPRLFLALCVVALAASCAPPRMVVRGGKEMPAEKAAELDFAPAEKAYASGRLEEAMKGYRTVAERYPDSRLASLSLLRQGQIEVKRDNPRASLAFFERILEKYPGSPEAPEARFQLGVAEHRLGMYADAIQILKSLVSEGLGREQETIAAYIIGEAFAAQRMYLDSLRWYARSWQDMTDPLTREATAGIIKEFVQTKLSPEDLEAVSREYSSVFPGDIAAFQLALRFMDARKYTLAEAWFKEFLDRFGSSDLAPRARAMLSRIERRGQVRRNVLGVILPLSGKFAAFGEKALKGVELAARVFDPDQREPVEIAIRDSKGVPSIAGEAVEDLVFDEGAMAVVGPLISVASEAAAFRAQDLGIPIVSLSQKEGLTKIGHYILRNSILPSQQARALVGYAMDGLGLKKFAVLYPKDPYGEDLTKAFIEEVQSRGGTVTGAEGYDPSQTDFGIQIKKIAGLYYPDLRSEEKKGWEKQRREELKALKEKGDTKAIQKLLKGEWKPPPVVDFEALFIPDYYDKVVLIAPQLAYYDVMGVQLLGSNGWNSRKLLDLGGRYVDGAVFTDGFYKDSRRPEVKSFVEEFRREFSEDPDILSALAYDTTRMLISVLRSGGVATREDVRRKLSGLRNYSGVTGPTSFDSPGDVEKTLGLFKVDGRSIREVETAGPGPAGAR